MAAEDARTILIIEDDRHTAALVSLYLARDGFNPLVAADGRAGLTLAREHQPALVILDLMLPRMDGWEVCRRLRQTAEVPVIMLTARGNWWPVSGRSCGAAVRPHPRRTGFWRRPRYAWTSTSAA